MKNKYKSITTKIVLGVAIAGIAFTSLVPATANGRVAAGLRSNRNSSTHLVTATPMGMRIESNAQHSMEIWLSGNVITITNGVARNNPLWGHSTRTTQSNPRQSIMYNGVQRTATISRGYVQANARIRRTASEPWSVTSTVRSSFN